jgi:HAD superfamily hydrolase (TIGR01509 family)
MKKLIIFDCDGVLVDSEVIAGQTSVDFFRKYGYIISLEECIRKMTGLNLQSTHELILKESGIDMPVELIESKVLEALEQGVYALMLPVLSSSLLHDNDICVASNSKRERVLMTLRVSKLLDFFKVEHIFTSSQVKTGKPAPDLFLFAANQMGYHPKDCLVIEDSISGIRAAKAASMKVIGFLGGSHATFPWYQQRIIDEDVAIANNIAELIPMIIEFNKS